MCFLIGNDFLPRFPGFKDIGNTLVEFVKIYFDNDFTLTTKDEDDDPSIDWEGLSKFITILASQEYSKLLQLATKNEKLKYPSRFIEQSLVNNDEGELIFSYNHYRSHWYKNELGLLGDSEIISQLESILDTDIGFVDSNDITKMVKNYLNMMAWNYLYYTKGTSAINMDLSYLHHHSPMIRDISAFLDNGIDNKNLKISGYKAKDGIIEFTALHQLVAVMPLKSKDLLPIELIPLFSFDSIIRDIFPDQFIIELDGIEKEEQEHLGLSIIPFVDRKRISDAVFQIHFTPERAKLWLPHKSIKRERPETADEKKDRLIKLNEYNTMKEEIKEKRLKSEQKDVNLSVKEVAVSKENLAMLENSKMLLSLGINIGSNTSINRFEANEKLPFINNKIRLSAAPKSPKAELIPPPKSHKLTTKTRQEPIIRSREESKTTQTRQEPVIRSRGESKTIQPRQEPVIRSREESKTIQTRQEPVIRSREESRNRQEPVIRSREESKTKLELPAKTKLELPAKKNTLLPIPKPKSVIKKPI